MLGDVIAVLYAATLLIGIGIGQALLPAVVKRHFAGRAVLIMGLYTVGFNLGAAIAAGATATLRDTFSGSWGPALGFWALLAVPAAPVAVPALVDRVGLARLEPESGKRQRRRVHRRPLARRRGLYPRHSRKHLRRW